MVVDNEYIGVVTEVLGQSRFYVFIYTTKDVDSGAVILCLLRKKAKSKYKNSYKRMCVNSVVKVEYALDEDVGFIKEKMVGDELLLCKKYNLPYYHE